MNKAFVKESDNDDDDDLPQAQALPAGTKNYMTPEGYERLRGELAHLMNVERPSVVQVVSGRRQWRPFRERRLSLRQETSARDRPPHALPDQAPGHRRSGRSRHPAQPRPGLFGATVLYSDKAGEDHTVTIVGVDEAEPLAGKISWISPVARAR